MNKKIIYGAVAAVLLGMLLIGIFVFMGLLDFDRGREASRIPEMEITLVSPNDGEEVGTGAVVYILALVNEAGTQNGSSPALAEVSFWINGSVVDEVAVDNAVEGAFSAKTEWTPQEAGSYSIIARAVLTNGDSIDSELVVLNVVGDPISAPAPTSTPTPNPTEAAETQEASETEEAAATAEVVESGARCDLFDAENTTLVLLDMPMLTTDLTLYIEMPTAVPGLEVEIEGDDDVWEYSAILGTEAANSCEYWGYSQRLYCMFDDLPEAYLESSQPLEVYVNHCSQPIYTHGWVSVLLPACEADLGEEACEWTLGEWTCADEDDEDTCSCVCDGE